jgi:uncharacterized membrane-anchored protein YitT (DUF2179 family)
MGAGAVSIAAILISRSKQYDIISLTIAINIICMIFAGVALYAIARKSVRILRIYFIWKCFEVVVIPIIDITTLAV